MAKRKKMKAQTVIAQHEHH